MLVGFLLAVLARAEAVLAANDLCGQMLVASTTFTADQTCAGPGLVAGASGITIDLGGFTLSGTGLASTGIDLGNSSGVTIKNGTVRGFDRGIQGDARHVKLSRVTVRNNGQEGAIITDATIDKCSFLTNGSAGLILSSGKVTSSGFVGNGFEGLFLQHSFDVTVKKVLAAQNLGAGIRVQFGSGHISVSSSTSAGNARAGVQLDMGTLTLKRSTIVGNQHEGVAIFASGTSGPGSAGIPAVIDGNLIAGNGREGIRLANTAIGNTITGNRLHGNAFDGVQIDAGSTGTLVKGNAAIGNRQVGFDVAEATTVLVKNSADANGAGIFAPGGAIDGGGNKAHANAGTQCSGAIACPLAFTPKSGSTIPTCGMHVGTSITLGDDPPFCTDSDGLVVDADGITIDLNGHRLHGNRNGATIGIDVGSHANVTIKNGIVQGFGTGISTALLSNGLTIANVEVRDSVSLGIVVAAAGAALGKSVIVANSGPGVVVGDFASGVKVSATLVVANTGDGLTSKAPGGVLTNVTAAGNVGAGIRLTATGYGKLQGGIVAGNQGDGVLIDGSYGALAPSTVKKALVVGNGTRGIALASNSVGLTLDSNVVDGNTDGVWLLQSPQGTLVEKNVLVGNVNEGLRVDSNVLATLIAQNVAIGSSVGFLSFPLTATVTKNVAAGNAMQGFAGNGFTDGGGNRAHDNGAEPQCTQGVACD